ncbi:MAG: hypothetical protein JRJ87_19650 [Deltaproteobacteria bacterium]|nr:hypothetical protein [Deltaproteobacteria bacterium]
MLLEKAAQMPYIAGAVVSLIVWAILFYPFFRGPARFFEAVKLAFRPDVINLFKGYEFQENFNKQAGPPPVRN